MAAYMTATCVLVHPTDSADQMFHNEMLTITSMDLTDIAYIGGQLSIDSGLNIALCICFTSYLVFLIFASSGLAICWYKIGYNLKKMRDISCVNYRFQKKLFILLTLQTSLPIMFNLIPCAIVMGLGLANIHAQNVVVICAMVLSFAQLCDPIFTVILVADYKRAVLKLLNRTCDVLPLPASVSNSIDPRLRFSGPTQTS